MPSSKKKVLYTLTNIYGINKTTSTNICQNLGINPFIKFNLLQKKKIHTLKIYLKQYYLTNEKLRQQLKNFKLFLTDIKCYKGLRNKAGLPVRGQRTHTNAKTVKKTIKKSIKKTIKKPTKKKNK